VHGSPKKVSKPQKRKHDVKVQKRVSTLSATREREKGKKRNNSFSEKKKKKKKKRETNQLLKCFARAATEQYRHGGRTRTPNGNKTHDRGAQ
jgi:hypothetical protein